jgi:glyoxylase-like metal-dependent hydrolase (beta-lactamase superfamily II)
LTAPKFLPLDDVKYGSVEQVTPLIRRVIADNPSKFTYRGTGTYIVGHGDVVVIDPGPQLDSHREALSAALAGERVCAILITHCHADHSPLAEWLKQETGAPTYAFGPHPRPDPADITIDDGDDGDGEVKIEESTDFDFAPDHAVADGEVVIDTAQLTMTAVHTPGHTSNHMCWSLAEEHTLFTGDHVMGWSTTVVSPADGDMRAYIDSLRKVAGRGDAVLWPTHGPSRADGAEYVETLVRHRIEREGAVLQAVRDGKAMVPELVSLLYADIRKELHKPAGRSVWAHLVKLVADGQVAVDPNDDGDVRPTLTARYRPL